MNDIFRRTLTASSQGAIRSDISAKTGISLHAKCVVSLCLHIALHSLYCASEHRDTEGSNQGIELEFCPSLSASNAMVPGAWLAGWVYLIAEINFICLL